MNLVQIQDSTAAYPSQPLLHLDTLWIQVAGTLCNLTCAHCFVPSGPNVRRHDFMSRRRVQELVAEGAALGVREVYFTGGEPFLHEEIIAILADTLARAPVTVLTNGTLFTGRRVQELAWLSEQGPYSLEIRVSLDGYTAPAHDAIRGAGTFERTIDGLARLARAGLAPIVTATQMGPEVPLLFRQRFMDMLVAAGVRRPRLKVLPLFKLGREGERTGGYAAEETLAGLPEGQFDPTRLQCASCRAATSQGVFVCPLLVDEPHARMGDTLAAAQRPFELRYGACYTCYVTGMTCANG